jgi:putative transposase, yhgA-like
MKPKDITQKMLEKYNDVFADILNVLLFEGIEVVDERSLLDTPTSSMLKIDNRIRSQDRDVAKYWQNSKINIALFGMENQTQPDKLMPFRVFGYDGSEYVKQSRRENRNEIKYPVITLVLYLGYETRWNCPKTLFECLNIDERIKPYVNDFKINLYEIAYLEREKISLFKSDFRILADYLYQMRINRDYIADKTAICHVEELLSLMSAMTGDNRFEQTISDLKGKEQVTMCEVLDRIEAKGIEKGIIKGMEKGIEKGRKEGAIDILVSLVSDKILSIDEAAARANLSVADFKKYIN